MKKLMNTHFTVSRGVTPLLGVLGFSDFPMVLSIKGDSGTLRWTVKGFWGFQTGEPLLGKVGGRWDMSSTKMGASMRVT